MNALIEEESYDEAAKLCVKLFGKNKEMWENEAYKFASIRQLKVLLYKLSSDFACFESVLSMEKNVLKQLNFISNYLEKIKTYGEKGSI